MKSFLKDLGNVLVGAGTSFVTSGGNPIATLAGGYAGYQAGKASDKANKQQQQAIQQAQGGIDAQVSAQREALAAGLTGQQISYDLMRNFQQQQRPWQEASLGALQTLPVLQQALGLPSYAIPQTIQGLPEVNFMQEFNKSLGQYGNNQDTGGPVESYPGQYDPNIQPPSIYPEGFRPTPKSVVLKDGTIVTAEATYPPEAAPAADLTPAAPGQFNMEASPLYNWQKKEVTETLRNQLAAQGLGQTTYAEREESRMREYVAANERERQIRDMFNMVAIGMGGIPQPTGAETMPAQAGAGAAQSAANIGAIQGQGAMGLAQMGINSSLANQSQQPAWMQAMQMASMFNQGFGGLFGQTPKYTTPTFANQPMQSTANSIMGMMNVPVPIFG